MAKEITLLRSDSHSSGDGSIRRTVFYQFPISPRIKNALNADVAPQIAADIPADALAFFTTGEKNALNNGVTSGDIGFVVMSVDQSAGETDPQFVARLKLNWAAIAAYWINRWRTQFSQTGTQVTAP